MLRARTFASAVMVLWAVVWIAMGFAVAREVRDLGSLSDTVVSLGQATHSAADALAGLEDLPVVGERLARPQEALRGTADHAIRSGRESRRSADRLGLLLGVSVAVIPIVAVAGLFLRPRHADRRRSGPSGRRRPRRAAA